MLKMAEIAALAERYEQDHGAIPRVSSIEELCQVLTPYEVQYVECSTTDFWGNRLAVDTIQGELQVSSFGRCGEPDGVDVGEPPREVFELEGDIVLRGNRFVRFPSGTSTSRQKAG